jgi:hypothetical protein
VTVEASGPEHRRSSNLQLGRERDDLRHFTSARQPIAGAHDRRHDRARCKDDTRRDYVRNVRAFAAFIGRSPDTATTEDLRLFQLHQTQSGMRPPSINNAVSALRFFFTVTLDRPDPARRLTVVPYPRRIPVVLSVALLRTGSASATTGCWRAPAAKPTSPEPTS